MVCPCIVAPYFMLGPLTYLYTYFSNNVTVLFLLVIISMALIYMYTRPKTINDNKQTGPVTNYNQLY